MNSVMQEIEQVTDAYSRKSQLTEDEMKAMSEQLKPLNQKSADLNKQYGKCMGMPSSEEEAKKQVEDRERDIEVAKQKWEAAAKPYASTAGNAPGMLMQPLQEPPKPLPSSGGIMPDGSGRTKEERDAALRAVNAELDRMPMILPKKENAPSIKDILKLAETRNAQAKKLFKPDELSAYAGAVNWVPRFDNATKDKDKAKKYSISVSSATNYFNKPEFIIAFASAVFALDPESVTGANNLASAIITAGERLNQGKLKSKEITLFQKDAEACYLYALATSMKGDAWTDNSLTTMINLGHLYIDMEKLDEARSLFQAARKQSPFSWDAAMGMAAYFHAVNKPGKAVAILEDDNLDKPEMIRVAKKASKALEKTEEVPVDSPDKVYEEHLSAVNAEPIVTSADFLAQIDQSERNKMRYFVENLPVKGSFSAPPIKKLTQYASLKAATGPQGESAMKDFMQMLQVYSMTSYASLGNEQLKMLKELGLDLDLGVDLNDVAKHPEKYINSKKRPNVKVDKTKLMENLAKWKKEAAQAKNGLYTGKTEALTNLMGEIDPSFNIIKLDPQNYADPMNIIIQKHNFAVLNRKTNLYNGYLFKINKTVHNALADIVAQYSRKIEEAAKIQANQLEELDRRRKAQKSSNSGGGNLDSEWEIMEHNIHVSYFNMCNNAAETAFVSATNVAVSNYMQKIKPKAEAYYYDVFRHIALISDPDIRNRKDMEMRQAITSALVKALNSVGVAYGSFKYHNEWECGCDVGALLDKRDAEREAREDEENARIMRNKNAKLAFESGEIPESTPLFKKIDGYGFDFDYFFFKGRMSPARTVVNFNIKLPIPGSPELFASQSISEFTGAATYGQGIKINIGADQGDVKAGAYFNLSSSVSTDGQGVVKDYSVTAGTGLSVSAKDTSVSVGGEMTFGPNGLQDSDFSAGISRDFSNQKGSSGSVAFEASTKRGCSFSGKAEHTLDSAKNFVDGAKEKAVGKDLGDTIPTDDFLKKETWSGKFSF